MTLPNRPLPLTLATLAALAVILGASLLLGADAVSLVVGAFAVAAAFALVVAFWFVPARRTARRQRRRDLRAARKARAQDRKAARRRATRQLGVTRRTVRESERTLLVQLEARDWLTRELDLPHPLPPTRTFAAHPDLLLELVQAVDRVSPEHVLELGGGVSSIVVARRLAQREKGLLTTLDHLPGYAEATRAELAAYGVSERARVLDAPLRDVELAGETWPWYELGPEVPERIDMLLVDGPPGATRPQARYPAVPLLQERLAPGALVLLDDTHREDEQGIIERWIEEIDGLELGRLLVARDSTLLVYRG